MAAHRRAGYVTTSINSQFARPKPGQRTATGSPQHGCNSTSLPPILSLSFSLSLLVSACVAPSAIGFFANLLTYKWDFDGANKSIKQSRRLQRAANWQRELSVSSAWANLTMHKKQHQSRDSATTATTTMRAKPINHFFSLCRLWRVEVVPGVVLTPKQAPLTHARTWISHQAINAHFADCSLYCCCCCSHYCCCLYMSISDRLCGLHWFHYWLSTLFRAPFAIEPVISALEGGKTLLDFRNLLFLISLSARCYSWQPPTPSPRVFNYRNTLICHLSSLASLLLPPFSAHLRRLPSSNAKWKCRRRFSFSTPKSTVTSQPRPLRSILRFVATLCSFLWLVRLFFHSS